MSANEETKPTEDPPDESAFSGSIDPNFEVTSNQVETAIAEILTDSRNGGEEKNSEGSKRLESSNKNSGMPLAKNEFQLGQYKAEKYMEEGNSGEDNMDLLKEQDETKNEHGKKRKCKIDLNNGAKRRSPSPSSSTTQNRISSSISSDSFEILNEDEINLNDRAEGSGDSRDGISHKVLDTDKRKREPSNPLSPCKDAKSQKPQKVETFSERIAEALQGRNEAQPCPEDEDCIQVNFHTVLCSDFNYDDKKDALVIAFGHPVSDFEHPIVFMKKGEKKMFESGFHVFKGSLYLHKEYMGVNIPYKYVVFKGDTGVISWELLPEYHAHSKVIVNRCLNVPTKSEVFYDKYDDVIWKSFTYQERFAKHAIWRLKCLEIFSPNRKHLLEQDWIKILIKAQKVKRSLGNQNDDQGLLEHGSSVMFRRTPLNYQPEVAWRNWLLKEFGFVQCLQGETIVERFELCMFQLVLIGKCIEFNDELAFEVLKEFVLSDYPKENFEAIFKSMRLDQRQKVANALMNLTNRFIESKVSFKVKKEFWIYAVPLIHWFDPDLFQWLPEEYANRSGTLGNQDWTAMVEILKIDEHFSNTFLHVVKPKICFEKLIINDDAIGLLDGCDLIEMLLFSARNYNDIEKWDVFKASEALQSLFESKKSERKPEHWKHLISRVFQDYNNRMPNNLMIQLSRLFLRIIEIDDCRDDNDLFKLSDMFGRYIQDRRLADMSHAVFVGDTLTTFKAVGQDYYTGVFDSFKRSVGRCDPEDCLEIYVNYANNFPKDAAKVLLQKPLDSLANSYGRSQFSLSSALERGKNWVLGRLQKSNLANVVEACLEQSVNPKEGWEDAIITYTNSPALCTMLKYFVPQVSEEIGKGAEKLSLIQENVEYFQASLDSGTLKIETVTSLWTPERQQRLRDLLNNHEIFEIVRELLKLRYQEANSCLEAEKKIYDFTKLMITTLNIDIHANDCYNNHVRALVDICHPRKLHDDSRNIERRSVVSDASLETIEGFQKLYDTGRLFRRFQSTMLNQLKEDIDDIQTIQDVLPMVENVLEGFKQFIQRLFSCEITVREIIEKIQNIPKQEYHKELTDLAKLCDVSNNTCGNVLEKIDGLFSLNKCRLGAQTMHNIAEIFNAKVDLSPIQSILNAEDNTEIPLAEAVTTRILKAGKRFLGWDEGSIKDLQNVQRCMNLIAFVRENIKSVPQLKNFVELASISAGEADDEVDRVLLFRDAITGYSPLLLEINWSNEVSFEAFLNAIHLVIAAIQNDRSLPQKLRDSNRLLEWIKAIKERHGSVEESSMTTVEQINASGVFTIDVLGIKVEFKQLENSTNDDIAKRVFEKEECDELRSKLMLITTGAEGKILVHRFVSLFGLVESLYGNLIKLTSSGCHLFSKWKATVYCDKQRKVSMIVDYGSSSAGLIQGNNNVETELEQSVAFLKEALFTWKNFMKDLRNDHRSLNYFTTDQLVALSHDLASFKSGQHLNRRSLMMLQLVATGMDDNHIIAQLSCLLEVQGTENSDSDVEIEEVEPLEKLSVADPFKDIKEGDIFKKLRDNFDENTALAAIVTHIDDYESGADADLLERLLDWAFENEDADFEDFLGRYKEASKKTNDHHFEPMEEDLSDAEKVQAFNDVFEIGDQTLSMAVKLAQVWDKFLNFINKLDISDYVSFKVIARILGELGAKSSLKPYRKMLPTLLEGKPNLIICPEKEILSMCISLYAFDEKPLPRTDEVLLCTADTSLEQIELLCQRAFHDKSGKIYTIVHAHNLDYLKCVHIESVIYDSTVTNHDYRLVFIASQEANDKSHIATSLEQYIAPSPPFTAEKLRSYVLKNLQNPEVSGPTTCYGRLVCSTDSGNGKSLVTENLSEMLGLPKIVTNIYSKIIDYGSIVDRLLQRDGQVYHFDFASQSTENKDDLIFLVMILRSMNKPVTGELWLLGRQDYCLVEVTVPKASKDGRKQVTLPDILPKIHCMSPRDSLDFLTKTESASGFVEMPTEGDFCKTFDNKLYQSAQFQRPYKSLAKVDSGEMPDGKGNIKDCLETILNNHPMGNPSWMEVYNFTAFLNEQMKLCKKSNFLSPVNAEDFPGFRKFATKFLIQMSKDFSTRSVEVSDESQGKEFCKPEIKARNNWEEKAHPYLFFNHDGHSLSFFGIFVDNNLSILNEKTGEILHEGLMNKYLYQGLVRNNVKFNQSLDTMPRLEQLNALALVFGLETKENIKAAEVDPSYELTRDNMLKMMAIWMRFKCGIPVIIMGETGSGKTRLVKFMCAMMRRDQQRGSENFFILKMHGGITHDDIFGIVRKGINRARENSLKGIATTVIFFDEANTSEAFFSIKTVLCDRLFDGEKIPDDVGLQFVCAVNPYREHSAEMINKLENAGLGYHIKASETTDSIGSIPLRRLVYRVKEIPASLFPLIFDFGKLDEDAEKKYTVQMVKKCLRDDLADHVMLVVDVLQRSQQYMRSRKDESSFVSLRDVERTLQVLTWFNSKNDIIAMVIERLPLFAGKEFLVCLVLSLGVTFFTRLEDRSTYLTKIVGALGIDSNSFNAIITACQSIFIDEMRLEKTIAKNHALMENVWMMVICIELRIPLFLVGKPGSSKSLAKSIVTDVLQGQNSYSDLFKAFKEVHMVSFQCSPLATAGGILSSFRQCQKYQEKRDLEKFTAVCVLDEVGLAEDSPKMPLKALHPLLEDGCIGDEDRSPWKKVSFVGISNWALDPAKMNRGLLLARGVPSLQDLITTGKGICANDEDASELLAKSLEDLAKGYQTVYEEQLAIKKREFFGLRDFYSLVKMLFYVVKERKCRLNFADIVECVQRNFGGFFNDFQPDVKFLACMNPGFDRSELIPAQTLILKALSPPTNPTETRFILLLTKNNAALNIIEQQKLLDNHTVIYGSSFPLDQEYTSLCKNINRIKVSMEVGQCVVLCNLDNLYESLYDALNQNYMLLGDTKYVDLGLGSHRLKARVNPAFRLILIAHDQDVYEKFPIPLINRLEKHYLGMETMLTPMQKDLVNQLRTWTVSFCQIKIQMHDRVQQFTPEDVFIGYHQDALASLVLEQSGVHDDPPTIIAEVKKILLKTAAPDSIARLGETRLHREERETLCEMYFSGHVTSLGQSIEIALASATPLLFVTTHSRLLTKVGKDELQNYLKTNVMILPLQQINTEAQFTEKISNFLAISGPKVLIVQMQIFLKEQGHLIDCVRYVIQNKLNELTTVPVKTCIAMVLQVPRIRGGIFIGLPGAPWNSLHIDELRMESLQSIFGGSFDRIRGKSLSEILQMCDVKLLIQDAIPKAVSLAGSDRVKRRLEILVDADEDLFDLLRETLLAKALNDQEKLYNPQNWLVQVAIKSVYLSEGNTFARAIWLHLVTSAAESLAEIITKLDLNGELEHAVKHSWQRGLFYVYVRAEKLEGTAYRNIKLSQFPFSCTLIKLLDRLLADAKEEYMIDALNENRFAVAANETMENSTEVIKAFCRDLLAVKIPGALDNEKLCDLFLEKLIYLAREASLQRINNNIYDMKRWNGITVVDVFTAFTSIYNRLKCVVEIVQICNPSIVLCLCKANDDDKSEFDLDNRAMVFAIDHLEPKSDMNERNFDVWKTIVKDLHSVMTSISNPSSQVIDKWNKLTIVELFLQDVWMQKCIEGETREAVFTKVTLLWRLKDINFTTSSKTFDQILKIIRKTSANAAEKLFNLKNPDSCFICKERFINPCLLPCGHLGCRECLEHTLNEKELRCPAKCKVPIPDNFRLESSSNCLKELKHHQNFRKGLNQFFLDLLRKLVFKGQLPHPDIIAQLMQFVVFKSMRNEAKITSKRLSPFEDEIDPEPVVRSFILQLLLTADFDQVVDHLNIFFHEAQFNGKVEVELCLLMINCFEDQLKIRSRSDQNVELRWIREYVNDPGKLNGISVQSLYLMSKLRLALEYFGREIADIIKRDNNNTDENYPWLKPLKAVVALEPTETLKKYLVRVVVQCTRQGCIEKWKKWANLRDLLPLDIQSSGPDNILDFYLFLELKRYKAPYKIIRDGLRTDLMTGKVEELQKLLQSFPYQRHSTVWKMALTNLVTIAKCQLNYHDVLSNFADLRGQYDTLVEPATKETNKALDEGMIALIEHCRIVFQESNNKVTRGFSKLCQGKAEGQYFPTMPHDDVKDIVGVLNETKLATKWFYCKNMHPYAIGDCGQPRQAGKCPCGAPIGGTNYRFEDNGQNAQQRQQATFQDQTKKGYLLGPAVQMQTVYGVREMSRLEVLVSRFILHASLFIGADRQPNSIKNLISCQPKDVKGFLTEHMKQNLAQIAKSIGSNEESSQLLLHKVIHDMFLHRANAYGTEWKDKKSVREWETYFAKQIIRPLSDNTALGRDMHELRSHFKEDMDGAKSAVLTVLEESGNSTLASSSLQPQFWYPRNPWNIDRFIDSNVGGLRNLKKKCPYLFKLQAARHVLQETIHLPDILALQRYIKKQFDGSLDLHEIAKLSVNDFFQKYWPQEDKTAWKNRVEEYVGLLDHLKALIFEAGFYGPKARESLESGQTRLDMNSNCALLIPNPHGLGNFSLGLVRRLLEANNDILPSNRIKNVDDLIEKDHILQYDLDDLNLLLVGNSRYEFELYGKGQARKFNIDIERFDECVFEKYFKNRPKYDEKTAPQVRFRHQFLAIQSKIDSKIKQDEKLPKSLTNLLDRELKGPQEVGYLMSKIEILYDILAEVGHSNEDDHMLDCMARLKIKIKGDYKALKGIRLTQIQPLLSHLRLIKAKMLTINREDPFTGLNDEFKDPLPPHFLPKLNEFCHHVRPDVFLEAIFNCVMEKLSNFKQNEDGHYIEMKLADLLVAYLESKESEYAYDFVRLDEYLRGKHISAVFQYIASKKI